MLAAVVNVARPARTGVLRWRFLAQSEASTPHAAFNILSDATKDSLEQRKVVAMIQRPTKLAAALAFTSVILLAAVTANARIVAPPEPLAQRVEQADKVFVGVLTNRKLLEGDWCHADLKVTQAIKGANVGDLVPVVWRPTIAGYDASNEQVGLAVLKYAHENRYWLRSDTFEDAKLVTEAKSILAANEAERLAELDAFWAEVSRAVRTGDFEAYKATCHSEGVLVSGTKNMSQPLSDALARWKKEFVATKTGEMKASVEFKFSARLGDSTTAHETGIFCYSTVDSEGNSKDEYVHLEGLLVKQDGKWKTLMEYQKSKATLDEWKALE